MISYTPITCSLLTVELVSVSTRGVDCQDWRTAFRIVQSKPGVYDLNRCPCAHTTLCLHRPPMLRARIEENEGLRL